MAGGPSASDYLGSRRRRAALTLGWKRGETGADFGHLGSPSSVILHNL